MTKFKVGTTYQTRSLCDYDCIFSVTILGRTEKTVTIERNGKQVRRKIRVLDNVERIDPFGRYSMSPIIKADREVA